MRLLGDVQPGEALDRRAFWSLRSSKLSPGVSEKEL